MEAGNLAHPEQNDSMMGSLDGDAAGNLSDGDGRAHGGGEAGGAAGRHELIGNGQEDVMEQRRRERARIEREERKKKRQQALDQIANSRQDDDEIQQIMSQAGKDREGAFCTGLLTVCFLLHFLVELDGLNMAGPIYSMQSVLSEHFESRIINLPEYADVTQMYSAEAAEAEQANTTSNTTTSAEESQRRAALQANAHLYGMMTIKDVTSVEHLPTFTRFVFDLVYPKERESSQASPYFSHHPEKERGSANDTSNTNDQLQQRFNATNNTTNSAKANNTIDPGATKGTATPAISNSTSNSTQAPDPSDIQKENSCAGIAAGAKCPDGDMTFLAEFNYFCGMKINVREAAMTANAQEQSRRVISDVKPADLDREALVDYTGSLLRHIDAAAQDTTGYDQAQAKLVNSYWKDAAPADQTYSQYFAGDLSRDEALAGLQRIVHGPFNNGTKEDTNYTGSWFDTSQAQAMISTEFKLAFYNQNADLGIILTYNFALSNAGVLTYTKSSGLYKPQNYATLKSTHGEPERGRSVFIIRLMLLALWALSWLVFFVYAVVDLVLRIKLFLLKWQFELDWFKYIEYGLLIMCLMVLLLWVELFPRSGGFKLPMDEAIFDTMDALTVRMHLYLRATAIIAVLLMAKNLKTLTSKFPAFGVLFETISAARMDLLYFTIISAVLSLALTTICYCLFGPNERRFNSQPAASMSILQMVFGRDLFPELRRSNADAAIAFFILYAITFYFVILNVYAAIVMRTYDNLRQKKQLLTEAMADIFAKQAREQTNRLRNFICCRTDSAQVEDSDEGPSSDSDDEAWEASKWSHEEYERRRRIELAVEKKRRKEDEEAGVTHAPSLQRRVMHQVGTLRDWLNPNANQMSVQAFEEKLKAAKAKIVRRRWRQREARIRKFGGVADEGSFRQLWRSLVFVAFISTFAAMLDTQQRTSEAAELAYVTTHNLQETLRFTPYKKYENIDTGDFDPRLLPSLTWANISQVGDIQDYLKQPIYNYLQERRRYNLDLGGNVIMASEGTHPATKEKPVPYPVDEVARIMINFHNEVENQNQNTYSAFTNQTEVWSTASQHLNISTPTSMGGDGGQNLTRADHFVEPTTGLAFDYYKNVDRDRFLTDQGHSGYLFRLSSNPAEAAKLIDQLYTIDFSRKYMRIAQINIDFVLYNVNYDLFQSVRLQFYVDGAGSIEKRLRCTKAELDHFDTSNENGVDAKKGKALLLEFLFLLFVLFETYKIYTTLQDEWEFMSGLERPVPKDRQEDSAFTRLLHRLGVEPQRIEGQNPIVVLVNVTKGLCLAAVAGVLKIAQLLTNILRKSFFNALDMVSAVVLYAQVAVWGEIISRGRFLTDAATGKPVNVIQTCGGVADYAETYAVISTLSIALIFVRMLQYFTFSKKLSAFSEIISAAAFDILFFAIMWCVMLLGFAIAFFALYGRELAAFRAVSSAYLAAFKMSANEFQYDEMQAVDSQATGTAFMFFMVTYRLLLSNMFIAIISAHYFQLQREAEEDDNGADAGFVALVLSILRSRLQKEEDDAAAPGGGDQAGNADSATTKPSKTSKSAWRTRLDAAAKAILPTLKAQIIRAVRSADTHLLGGAADDDHDELSERREEIKRHKHAMANKYEEPDILDYDVSGNKGLKPFIQTLRIAKQGKEALSQFQKNKESAALAKNEYAPSDLVNSNVWLQALEERLQRLSNYRLSLYDFQNHETVYSALLEEYNSQHLTIMQKQLLKLSGREERLEFIKARLRRTEADSSEKENNTNNKQKDGEEADKSEAKEDDGAGATGPGNGTQGNGSSGSSAPRSYRSQIDYLFLIWKALDFEQLFDAVNAEEPDQILGVFQFMNDSQNRTEAEDGGASTLAGYDLGAKSGRGLGDAGLESVRQPDADVSKASEEQQRKKAAEIADAATIRYHHLMSSKLYKDKQLNQVTDLQHELWTTVLDHYERHCLWFNIFNTLDRVRLWNRLVFSEGYFRLLANPARHGGRRDLREYLRENLDSKAADELVANWDKYAFSAQNGEEHKKAAPGDEKAERAAELRKREKADGLARRSGQPAAPTGSGGTGEIELPSLEWRRIRDRHYTPDVMRELWNMIKQRRYPVEGTEDDAKGAKGGSSENSKTKGGQSKAEDGRDQQAQSPDDEKSKKYGHNADKSADQKSTKRPKMRTAEMPKGRRIEVIRTLFRQMIHGVSHDRLVVRMDEAMKRGPLRLGRKKVEEGGNQEGWEDPDFLAYHGLATETYDPAEYRLPLWLPLSLEQKLDMILHQRIPEEVEMMQFLVDEECGCGQNQQARGLKKYEDVDKTLERALDGLAFQKYMALTRMQAMNASIQSCNDRLENHKLEDERLLTYANFLIEKQQEAANYEAALRLEMAQKRRQNAMLVKKIGQQMKQKPPADQTQYSKRQ